MTSSRRTFITRVARAGGGSAAYLTMQALGLLPDRTMASPLPKLAPGSGAGSSVVILGAGIADLVAAYELGKAGYRCTVPRGAHPSGWTQLDDPGRDEDRRRRVCLGLQDRVGVATVLGAGRQHLRRHLVLEGSDQPRVVPERSHPRRARHPRQRVLDGERVEHRRSADVGGQARCLPHRHRETASWIRQGADEPGLCFLGRVPHSLGSWVNRGVGASGSLYYDSAYRVLQEPDDRIYFAGDHLSQVGAWQEGAMLSAHRTVAALAAKQHAVTAFAR